jgi:hypothetical protein
MTTHPGSQEADVVLRDGSTVHVRPARPSDARATKLLLTGLSDRSRWLRFFSAFPNVPKGRPMGHKGRQRPPLRARGDR